MAELVAVGVLLFSLACLVTPQFGQAAYDARVGSLDRDRHALQRQVEHYRTDHKGRLPTADAFSQQMTRPTLVDGTLFKGQPRTLWYGPYMEDIPVNPFTGGNRIATSPEEDADWLFDESTGRIQPLGEDPILGEHGT